MTLATVPSCAKTTSVMPPTYSLSSVPSTSGAAVSTSEVKPAMSVKIAATSRQCTSMPSPSPSAASLEAICGEKYREREACARSASSWRRRAHHLDVAHSLFDGHFEIAEIDRLGQEIERPAVHRGTDVAHVAIGRNDDGRFLFFRLLQFLQQGKAVHPRHIDVGHHHVDMRMILDRGQCFQSVVGEHEGHRAVANLLAEFLQDQSLEIGLIVDEEDRGGHAACSSLVSISSRSSAKSIGLVRSPTAPRSIALRRVSASP